MKMVESRMITKNAIEYNGELRNFVRNKDICLKCNEEAWNWEYDFKYFEIQSELGVPIQGVLIDVNDWETFSDVSGCY